MLVVAITAPILGAIADFSGAKKRFLFLYTALACLFTAMLFFVESGNVLTGMLFFVLAEIGYRSAQVFYNSLLPEIAAPDEIGRVSGTGWAVGSAGGIVCLLLVLVPIRIHAITNIAVSVANRDARPSVRILMNKAKEPTRTHPSFDFSYLENNSPAQRITITAR